MAGLFLIGLEMLGLSWFLGRHLFLLNPVSVYLKIYFLLFGLYVYAAARLAPRLPRACVALILTFGVLFRLMVLPAPPSLTTDMYRYAWDGRLIQHHINPYRWAPNAAPLRPLRGDLWNRMEYRAYDDIYMPVSQGVFAGAYALFGEDLRGFKAIYILFDIGVMGLIVLLLRQLGFPPTQVIWYAWCPLPITEIALAGHQDIVGVFFLMLAFALAYRKRYPELSAVALVAAALTKGFALLLLPLFCRTFGKRFTRTATASLFVLGLPLWVALPDFLHGMKQYLDNVHVNAGLFHILNEAMSPITRRHYVIVKYLSDAAILAVTAWAAWRPAYSLPDLLRRAFIVLAVTLLVVPTLFPWYLVWGLPFMALLGRRPSWAFVLLTGLVSLLYTYYISMMPYPWLPLVEYLPFYIVALWEYRGWRREHQNERHVPEPGGLRAVTYGL